MAFVRCGAEAPGEGQSPGSVAAAAVEPPLDAQPEEVIDAAFEALVGAAIEGLTGVGVEKADGVDGADRGTAQPAIAAGDKGGHQADLGHLGAAWRGVVVGKGVRRAQLIRGVERQMQLPEEEDGRPDVDDDLLVVAGVVRQAAGVAEDGDIGGQGNGEAALRPGAAEGGGEELGGVGLAIERQAKRRCHLAVGAEPLAKLEPERSGDKRRNTCSRLYSRD